MSRYLTCPYCEILLRDGYDEYHHVEDRECSATDLIEVVIRLRQELERASGLIDEMNEGRK